MSGTAINFRYFPAGTWRVPGFYGEFDASQANTAQPNLRALLIGQKLAAGTAVADTPVQAFSQGDVNAACGADSMLARMYAAYRLQDATGECWLLPLADNAAGTAATGTIAVTGTATASGTLALYVMGQLVPVAVNAADTATVVATAIAAAINAAPALPVSAAAATGTVTVTALHKGLALNDVDMRINYRGVQNGETTPAGLTVTITAMTGGATNPTLTNGLANLGVQSFDFIALPYTDSASLTAIADLLSDQSGRWSAIEMLYGHCFAAYRGTVSARSTFGVGNNNQHISILGYYDSPTPAWLEAADWAGAHAAVIRTNPALGVVGQPLNLLAPPIASRDTPAEQNVLLYDGLSTFTVDAHGQSRIGRSITTYQSNASAQPDDSYLNTNLLFQAMYVARYLKANVLTQYQNRILVDNGAIIGPGSPAVTPELIFAGICAMYGYLCTQFVVQNPDTFAKAGYAQKGQKGQVLAYLPLDFGDQVLQVAALFQFRQST